MVLRGIQEKMTNPLKCSKCKESKAEDKYYPYCSIEHWTEAVTKP